MGKIRRSHTNLNSWPRKVFTVSKNKYTSQFISVIQESTSMPKKIGEKKLKSSHPIDKPSRISIENGSMGWLKMQFLKIFNSFVNV